MYVNWKFRFFYTLLFLYKIKTKSKKKEKRKIAKNQKTNEHCFKAGTFRFWIKIIIQQNKWNLTVKKRKKSNNMLVETNKYINTTNSNCIYHYYHLCIVVFKKIHQTHKSRDNAPSVSVCIQLQNLWGDKIEQKSYSLELLQRPDYWKPWKMASTLHKLLSDTNVSWFSVSWRSKQNLDILIISTLYKIVRDVFLHFRYLQNVQMIRSHIYNTVLLVCMYVLQ